MELAIQTLSDLGFVIKWKKISGSAHPKAGVARLILEDPFLLNSLAKRVLSAVETAGDKVLSLSKHFSEGTRESPGSHGVRRTCSAKSQIQMIKSHQVSKHLKRL